MSGQDVLTEDHETPSETFGVVVEDENGAAQVRVLGLYCKGFMVVTTVPLQSLCLDSARTQFALEFPKVCVVLGKESRPAANDLLRCGAPCVICVCSGGGPPITPQISRYVTCTIVSELIKMSEDDTVDFVTIFYAASRAAPEPCVTPLRRCSSAWNGRSSSR